MNNLVKILFLTASYAIPLSNSTSDVITNNTVLKQKPSVSVVYTNTSKPNQRKPVSKVYSNKDFLVSMSNKQYKECILTELDHCKCINKINKTNLSCNKGNYSKVKSLAVDPFSSESGRIVISSK